jgi:hypothetical protein
MKILRPKNLMTGTPKRTAQGDGRAEGSGSPVETLAAPAWRLPGGVRLAEYALRGGFVASSLLMRGARAR